MVWSISKKSALGSDGAGRCSRLERKYVHYQGLIDINLLDRYA